MTPTYKHEAKQSNQIKIHSHTHRGTEASALIGPYFLLLFVEMRFKKQLFVLWSKVPGVGVEIGHGSVSCYTFIMVCNPHHFLSGCRVEKEGEIQCYLLSQVCGW